MPRISSFFGITIWIYWDDHNPPHFHAEYGEQEILIQIEDLRTYSGSLSSRAYNMVMEWAALHRDELMICWRQAQEDLSPNKIEPLR